MYDRLEETLRSGGMLTPAKAEQLVKARSYTLLFMGHLHRCTVQQHRILHLIDDVSPTHAHLVLDFKNKVLPKRHRTPQSKFFGLRGMSLHRDGALLYVSMDTPSNDFDHTAAARKGATVYKKYQAYYFDDIPTDNDSQDVVASICFVDALLVHIKRAYVHFLPNGQRRQLQHSSDVHHLTNTLPPSRPGVYRTHSQ
jgi:hypothetical protein